MLQLAVRGLNRQIGQGFKLIDNDQRVIFYVCIFIGIVAFIASCPWVNQ